MIKLFGTTDTIYTSNGDMTLQPLRAIVHKEDNGAFYLELEAGLEYINDITDRRIIVCDTPQGEQAFRITSPTITRTKIKAKAQHVFYDTQNYLIEDSYVVDKNCNDALDHLNSATEPASPYTTISDVPTVTSYRCVRESLYSAIKTVVERWGGHLVRDNYNIGVRESIGQDNGVVIRYAKNLKDITKETDWSTVVTKLLPVGKDGTLLNAYDSTASLYVESETQYDTPFTKTVSFDQSEIEPENYDTPDAYLSALVSDLKQKAQAYVDEYCLPRVNYSLAATVEKLTDIGDTIQVIDEVLGINIMTNVISYEYDAISKRYTNLEFGNFRNTLSNLIGTINTNTNKIVTEQTEAVRVTLSSELEQATAQIWATLGNSYVIYDGDKILVLDRLPKETAQNVIMINAGGIGFSSTGINGTFNSAWSIDGTMNMQAINVINFTADLIKGGTLKLGSNLNQSGVLELYDEQNNLIGIMDKSGLKMYGADGSYVLMNQTVGFAGYDKNDNKIYWVDADEFHMRKSVIEEEITLCNKMRFIPISIYDGYTLINDGIGLVSVSGAPDGGLELFVPSDSDGLIDSTGDYYLVRK